MQSSDMDDLLFELQPLEPVKGETCRTCSHRERWQAGGSFIQYCGVLKSNRTFNGKKKIKVTTPACLSYENKIK